MSGRAAAAAAAAARARARARARAAAAGWARAASSTHIRLGVDRSHCPMRHTGGKRPQARRQNEVHCAARSCTLPVPFALCVAITRSLDVRPVVIPLLGIISIGDGGVRLVRWRRAAGGGRRGGRRRGTPWGRSSRLACLVARLPGGVDVGLREVAIRKIRRRRQRCCDGNQAEQ